MKPVRRFRLGNSIMTYWIMGETVRLVKGESVKVYFINAMYDSPPTELGVRAYELFADSSFTEVTARWTGQGCRFIEE